MFGSLGNLFHTHHGKLVSQILVGIKGVLVFTPQGVWVQTVRYLIGMMKSAPIDNGHLIGGFQLELVNTGCPINWYPLSISIPDFPDGPMKKS